MSLECNGPLFLFCLHTQVFPPFRLIPRKMTLIIGAMMQVRAKGHILVPPTSTARYQQAVAAHPALAPGVPTCLGHRQAEMECSGMLALSSSEDKAWLLGAQGLTALLFLPSPDHL